MKIHNMSLITQAGISPRTQTHLHSSGWITSPLYVKSIGCCGCGKLGLGNENLDAWQRLKHSDGLITHACSDVRGSALCILLLQFSGKVSILLSTLANIACLQEFKMATDGNNYKFMCCGVRQHCTMEEA